MALSFVEPSMYTISCAVTWCDITCNTQALMSLSCIWHLVLSRDVTSLATLKLWRAYHVYDIMYYHMMYDITCNAQALTSLSCIRHHVLSYDVWHHLRHSSFDEPMMYITCNTPARHPSPRPIFQEDTTLSKFPYISYFSLNILLAVQLTSCAITHRHCLCDIMYYRPGKHHASLRPNFLIRIFIKSSSSWK